VEGLNERVDVTKRQTLDVLSFKQDKKHAHNQTFQDRLKQ
jgi:hypothetical protein